MKRFYEITELLKSNDYYVKEYALDAMRKHGVFLPSTVAVICEFLKNEKDLALRSAAIKLLIEKKQNSALDFFFEMVSRENSDDVKILIYEAIEKLAPDYLAEKLNYASGLQTAEFEKKRDLLIDNLINNFKDERNLKIRSKVIRALSKICQNVKNLKIEREFIFDLLTDPDPRIRANACEIPADIYDKITKAEYKRLLSDSVPRVMAQAGISLYKSGELWIIDHFEKLLAGETSGAKIASLVYALGCMPSRRSFELLIDQIGSAHSNVRKIAVESLSKTNDIGAIKPLINLYMNEFSGCRENLSKIINTLRHISCDQASLNIISELVKCHDDKRKVATLVKLLSHFADQALANNFIKYLSDEDARVRANTIEALMNLKERGIVDHEFMAKNTLLLICDKNSRVMANAARALYGCGIVNVASVLREMLGSNVMSVQKSAQYTISKMPQELFPIAG